MPAPKDVEKKIEALREKIRHHEYLYYVLDNPSRDLLGHAAMGAAAMA